MRSRTGLTRKLLAQYGLSSSIQLPSRSQYLQKLCGVYVKDQVRGESPQEFQISVDPVHILRAGDTRHFNSCLDVTDRDSEARYTYLLDYLSNRYCAIVFVRNKRTGQYLARTFVHHVLAPGNYDALCMEYVYGSENFPFKFFCDTMFKKGILAYSYTYAEVSKGVRLGILGKNGYYLEPKYSSFMAAHRAWVSKQWHPKMCNGIALTDFDIASHYVR